MLPKFITDHLVPLPGAKPVNPDEAPEFKVIDTKTNEVLEGNATKFLAYWCQKYGSCGAKYELFDGAKLWRATLGVNVTNVVTVTRRSDDDQLEVISLMHEMGYSKDEVVEWMNTPLPAFDGRTPFVVIEAGHKKQVMDMFLALAQGNVST